MKKILVTLLILVAVVGAVSASEREGWRGKRVEFPGAGKRLCGFPGSICPAGRKTE